MVDDDFAAHNSLNEVIANMEDICSLIECAQSELEAEPGDSAVRVLQVAHEKLIGAIDDIRRIDLSLKGGAIDND